MTALTVSCIVVGGVGLLIAFMSLLFFRHTVCLKRKCSAHAMGTVIDYRRSKGSTESSIAPVAEFRVDGDTYTAYRHYKGVVSSRKVSSLSNDSAEEEDYGFYISDSDWFHKYNKGAFAYYSMMAKEKWPIGMEIPVVYNPRKPKQAYVEKVVTVSNIVGIVLLSVGAGVALLAGLIFILA